MRRPIKHAGKFLLFLVYLSETRKKGQANVQDSEGVEEADVWCPFSWFSLSAAPDPPGDLKLLVACQGPDTAVVWIPTAMDTLMTLNRPRHGFDP